MKLWPIIVTLLVGAIAYGTMKEKVNKMSDLVVIHSETLVEHGKAIAVSGEKIENIDKNVERIIKFMFKEKRAKP